MQKFIDSEKRTWEVVIDINAFKRVKAYADYDLANLINITAKDGEANGDDEISRLAADEVKLGEVIYAIVKPQCDKENVSEEQFYAAFKKDAINDAFSALLKEYADFFPNPKGEYAKKVVEMTLRAMEKGKELLHDELQKLDVEKALSEAVVKSTAE